VEVPPIDLRLRNSYASTSHSLIRTFARFPLPAARSTQGNRPAFLKRSTVRLETCHLAATCFLVRTVSFTTKHLPVHVTSRVMIRLQYLLVAVLRKLPSTEEKGYLCVAGGFYERTEDIEVCRRRWFWRIGGRDNNYC